MSKFLVTLCVLLLAAASTSGFSPIVGRTTTRCVSPLKMSEEKEKPATPPTGTFYDDEVEPAKKEGISDSMKARLRAEASTGLDPDSKNTNVLLYIILGVAVLVLLGGQGILF